MVYNEANYGHMYEIEYELPAVIRWNVTRGGDIEDIACIVQIAQPIGGGREAVCEDDIYGLLPRAEQADIRNHITQDMQRSSDRRL